MEVKDNSATFSESMIKNKDWEIVTTKTLFNSKEEYKKSRDSIIKVASSHNQILALVTVWNCIPAADWYEIMSDLRSELSPICTVAVAPVYNFDDSVKQQDEEKLLALRLNFFNYVHRNNDFWPIDLTPNHFHKRGPSKDQLQIIRTLAKMLKEIFPKPKSIELQLPVATTQYMTFVEEESRESLKRRSESMMSMSISED